MLRSLLAAGLAVALFVPVARGKGSGEDTRIETLLTQLSRIELDQVGFLARRSERQRTLEELASLRSEKATQAVVVKLRSPTYADVFEPVLRALVRHSPEAPPVLALLRERLGRDDPLRPFARDALLALAVERRDDRFLFDLLESTACEDRFLAMKSLCSIGHPKALASARRLLADRDWRPQAGTVVSCATLALAAAGNEGAEAARLLLLLRRDPRFTRVDLASVREATRLWRDPNLLSHIRMSDLADPDAAVRAELASFMGEAGIETARAPLVALVESAAELPAVRAAAAAALGSLKIARGDLAATLEKALTDPEPVVKLGAIRGLTALRVWQAGAALGTLLEGPLASEARAALAAMTGLPAETPWDSWLLGPDCTLPPGT
ncbi:MAG: HEAT repeat domain-containing protein [Planctomycetaceae bacterium]